MWLCALYAVLVRRTARVLPPSVLAGGKECDGDRVLAIYAQDKLEPAALD